MKNQSPKVKVLEIMQLAGCVAPEVRGTRIKGRFGGDFLAEAIVNENVVCRTRHRNWRNAYKMLHVQVSRMFVH